MNNTLKQTIFYDLMQDVAKDYVVTESIDDSDYSAAIYEAIEEFFVENYKHLTLEEQSYSVLSGQNVNEELFDVLAEITLDESIGSAIATAVHGIGQKLSQRRAERDTATAAAKTSMATKLASKSGLAAQRANRAEKSAGNSVVGSLKSSFQRARAEKSQERAKKAYAVGSAARQKSQMSTQSLAAKQQKRADLATKIDTKISNAKKAVHSGLKKAAGFAGRIAGRLVG